MLCSQIGQVMIRHLIRCPGMAVQGVQIGWNSIRFAIRGKPLQQFTGLLHRRSHNLFIRTNAQEPQF